MEQEGKEKKISIKKFPWNFVYVEIKKRDEKIKMRNSKNEESGNNKMKKKTKMEQEEKEKLIPIKRFPWNFEYKLSIMREQYFSGGNFRKVENVLKKMIVYSGWRWSINLRVATNVLRKKKT